MTRAVAVFLFLLASGAACNGSHAVRPDGGNPGDSRPPGGSDGGNDGDGDGGGGNDSGAPPCADVCWAPQTPPVMDPTMPPPVTDITVTACNANGLRPGMCPTGFACTGTEIHPIDDTHSFRRPLCEPSEVPITPIVLDLPPTVPVRLTFTLNGGPWPISTSASTTAAGQIFFSARGSGTSFSRSIPAQSGELEVDLGVGVYDVQTITTFVDDANTHYPVSPLVGVLTVAAAGSAQLDFVGHPITFALHLDGAAFPVLNENEFLTLIFVGRHGQRGVIFRSTRFASQDPSGVIALAPDTYQVTLDLGAGGNPPRFPTGTLVLDNHFEVTAARSVVFDLTTYPVAGAVRIDGAAVPAEASAHVAFGANQFAVSGTTSRYEGRLLSGINYDVVFRAFSSPTTPSGVTRVTPSFLDGPATFDVDITTTTFSGAITLNGAAPPSTTSRGLVRLAVPGSGFLGQGLLLDKSGDARWSDRVFTGTYDIQLFGQNVLPTYPLALESNVAIVAPVTRNYNVEAATVRLELRVDGAQPTDATVDRGRFFLQRRGPGSRGAISVTPPRTGPFTTSVMLEAGTWSVELTSGFGYTGFPLGSPTLEDVTVGAGSDATTSYDLHSVVVAGELRKQGAVPASGPRGTVSIFGAGSGGSAEVSTTGPAAFSVRAFPSVYDFSLSCAAGCGDLTAASSLQLASGLRYP